MNNDTKYGNYYECHITIEPVFGDRLLLAETIAKKYNFKVANLLMQKDRTSTEERSDKDTFMTSYSINFQDIGERMTFCVHDLRMATFKVWRQKIEDIVLDERFERT